MTLRLIPLPAALALLGGTLLFAADTHSARKSRPGDIVAPCTTSLPDGRSFLTGSGPRSDSKPWASFFTPDGAIATAPQPLAPRTAHICIALNKSLILVAGGSSGEGGPTSSAELFDLDTNSWTTTGSMRTARTSAAAILLPDGRVLVAGGETSGSIANSLEIFDPKDRAFRLASGVLSSPRAHHAIARLSDGRILIAGGNDGRSDLATADIFDPKTEEVRPAGFLLSPRADFTATEITGGKVLMAGGAAEAASAELFDPATGLSEALPAMLTDRRSHLALKPANAENVLLAAGTCDNAECATAEIFDAKLKKFVAAGEYTDPANTIRVTVASVDASGKPRRIKAWALPVAMH